MSENILEIAEKLNSEVTRLNTERSKMEGMLESAKSNYEKAVKAYEMKYGVTLDEKSLQSEYNAVYARTKGAVLDLQEKVESIKRGDYKNNAQTVSFDMEPDVEPIRAEVKSDKVIPSDNSSDVKDVLADAEDITEGSIEPSLSFEGFTGFNEPTVEEKGAEILDDNVAPKVEVKVEVETPVASEASVAPEAPKSKRGRPRKNAPIDASELKRAMEAMEEKPQTPIVVTPPDIGVVDDEDDEVSLDGMNFGQNPIGSDFNFGGFGVENVNEDEKSSDTPVEEKPAVEDAFGFGDFGGFGDLNIDVPAEEDSPADGKVSEPIEEKKEDAEPSFGGFGDLDLSGIDFGFGTDKETKDTKSAESEKKEETITPEGWGNGFDFNFDNVGDILNNSNGSFGQ